MPSSCNLIHLSFYRFYPVGDEATLICLRMELKAICSSLKLNGTILLASEGINAMVAGPAPSIEEFKAFARTHCGVEDRDFKEAPILTNSFNRLCVKIKKEIISVGSLEIRPDLETAQRISPSELKKWIQERRSFVLLDTRNKYEVEVGTFEGAVDLGLESSREFSSKAAQNLDRWKHQEIVTFCTGGIRCEKASAVLLKLGLKNVFQLDGGILRYFEENGAQFFKGNCFVFDWRLAVDGTLKPVPRSDDANQQFGRHRTH